MQPLKHRGPQATDAQRVEMLRLAIADETAWRVYTLEIDRGGLSYTIDTLRELHAELTGADLFFLIGSDALRDVARWKEPREIFRLATPLVAHRAGEPAPELAALASLCQETTQPIVINMPTVEVSSTEIRRLIARREPIDALVPAAVAAYIGEEGLYG